MADFDIMTVAEYMAELRDRVETEFAKRGYVYDKILQEIQDGYGAIVVECTNENGNVERQSFNCYENYVSRPTELVDDDAAVDGYFSDMASGFADYYMRWNVDRLKNQQKRETLLQLIRDPAYVRDNVYVDLVDTDVSDPNLFTIMYDDGLNLAYAFSAADPECRIWRRLIPSDVTTMGLGEKELLRYALGNTERHIYGRLVVMDILDAVLAHDYEIRGCATKANKEAYKREVLQCYPELKNNMHVLRIDRSCLRSSAILLSKYAMSKAASECGIKDKMVVIPSSVEELLIQDLSDPSLATDANMMRRYVVEVNANMNMEKVLSNKPFLYDLNKAELTAF